jgi:hypothetical protein
MRFEVRRRPDDRGALVGRDAHRDHVALDELAEVDAGIEVSGDEIEARFVRRRDVEDDVGIGARKRAKLRGEHHRRRQWRDDQTHAAGRPFAQAGDVLERTANVRQRGIKASDELFARVGWRNAARGPRQQPNPDLLFESIDGMAERRG